MGSTRAGATCGILGTHNGIVATDYLQHSNRNGSFHLIDMIITRLHMSYHMKAYENLRRIVKTV